MHRERRPARVNWMHVEFDGRDLGVLFLYKISTTLATTRARIGFSERFIRIPGSNFN